MNPKVTVVVPSFNVGPYIGQCLDSILNQTLSEIEVIVVDANSSDGTREKIIEYMNMDNRVILVDDFKKSTGYAKNVAIDMAKAPYYAIVESDDYIEPDMLEKLYNKAEETGVDFVKANFSTFLGEGRTRYDFPKTVAANPDDYEKILNPKKHPDCFKWIMFEWLGLYRVSFLREKGIRHNETPGAAFQDTGFWFLSFANADSIYLMKEHFYHYRCDNPYASVKDSKKALNICVEYDFIYKELKEKSVAWEDVKSEYCRDFFYDNYVVFNRIDEELKPKLVSEMRRVLLGIFDESIDKSIFDEEELEKIKILLESETAFLEAESSIDSERLENERKLIEKVSSGRDLLVYGAGSYGTNLQYFLQSKGYDIKAFIDGDLKKQGTLLNGKDVISLESARARYNDALIIVTNKNHAEEIHSFLSGQGITEKDIYDCDISKCVKILI